MSDTPSDMPARPPDTPTSEVRLPETAQDHPTGQSDVILSSTDNQMWKMLFEMQQRQMMELIRTIKEPSTKDTKLVLPEFNPESKDSDARAWCATVDLCMQEKELTSSNLIIALSRALKGTAASWLAQNSFAGITWTQIKDSFLARFDYVETPAATLYRLLNENPNDGECLASYANRFLSTLMNRWSSLSNEQIAIAVTLAHASKTDPRLQRLAFTTEINTRVKMQQELMAYTYRKRGPATQDKPLPHNDAKRPRVDSLRRCYLCNKPGHLAIDCRVKNDSTQASTSKNTADVPTKLPSLTCFSCGVKGHVSTRCPKKEDKSSEAVVERRVDICTVKQASDQLSTSHGEKYSFCFDSGAECSLIRESVAEKFPGKRQQNNVNLLGIDKRSTGLQCNIQILATVNIQGFSVQLLFYTVPDDCISQSIQVGRDLLALGYAVEMTEDQLIVKKIKTVAVCEVGSKVNGFQNIDTDIPGDYRGQLLSCLEENAGHFVEGTPTGRVSTGQLEIKLADPNRTVQRRPYRLSVEERELVRDKIKDLLDAGIIQESCSPFSSPILLVKKKDGTDRLCVDYRELNNNTVPDRYPLPIISDQIQRLVGANYFTSLDMASGYHQIPVHKDSIERTSFVTPDGQFEYLTMPFGLRNAPAVYQRAINKALGPLGETFAVVYLDDVIIPSRTVEEGLDRLRQVLGALSSAGFSLNLKKCAFLKREVEYLGYHVSAGEIRPNPRKIKALTELAPPETVTQLRQFIGLASYFRQFIPGFSQKTAPLYRLTAGKGKIVWTPEFEKIRQDIVAILTDKPVLTIFDPDQPIEVHTDASAEGYGAILMQPVDGKLRVIEYYSRRTSSAESRYHSYELETLAVVNAIKHFRHYLHGRKFKVVTDWNAVKASKSKVDLTPRVHRWWCFLQTFEFDIEYRQGKNMSHVDFLSRNPLPVITQQIPKVEQKRVHLTEISDSWLQAEQQKDDEVRTLIEKLNCNELNDDIAKTFEIRRGVLHRKIERNNRSVWLPVVPRPFQWAVINHVHESIMHLGWEKTLEKAFCHYWFPNMNKYVRKFVDNCITCRVSKSHSGKVQAELHPIPKVTTPWHTIHMDATGKLSGKRDTKEYVFVTIDAFTKYVLLHHSLNIDAKSAIKALQAGLSLFGAPTRIISDQGRCFAGKEFKDFCTTHNVSLHLIATGSCRANGQVERVMSTLKNMLTAVETGNHKSWQAALPEIQLAINCTFNRTTRASPLELLIGKVARPLQLMTLDTDDTTIDLDSIREQATRAINTNASREKDRFDNGKAKVKNFEVNDYVLIENHERNKTKLEPKFKGPFRVAELLDGDRYLLKALNSNRTYKYAHDRLRRMPDSYVPLELNTALETTESSIESGCPNGADGPDSRDDTHEDV